jgi:hypothetical protein
VGFVASFTCQFVYAAFNVIPCSAIVFADGLLLYSVCAIEGYVYVGLFKEVGDFPDLGAVVRKSGPFIAFVFSRLGFVLYMCFQFYCETWKLLFLAMVCIFCHSTCLLSAVRGRDIILLIRKL